MLTITDNAVEKAKEILAAEGKSEWGIRIFMSGGSACCGPSFGMDLSEKPEEGDEVIEKSGLKLFAEKDAAMKLKNLVVDFMDDGETQGFVIRDTGPSSCGCCGGGA